MALTESLAMTPAASVSGFYLAHPESTYFNVGKIGDDQLADWARRATHFADRRGTPASSPAAVATPSLTAASHAARRNAVTAYQPLVCVTHASARSDHSGHFARHG